MFSFLPGIPGADDLRVLARKVDTARHHGVPNGCVLELDLLAAPPETTGFDPMAIISGGRPMVLREAVAAIHRAAEDDRVAGLIARVQIPAAAPA
ncbi:MAG: signal peptide peptidase SppA, partial [Mycobacterium sp.]